MSNSTVMTDKFSPCSSNQQWHQPPQNFVEGPYSYGPQQPQYQQVFVRCPQNNSIVNWSTLFGKFSGMTEYFGTFTVPSFLCSLYKFVIFCAGMWGSAYAIKGAIWNVKVMTNYDLVQCSPWLFKNSSNFLQILYHVTIEGIKGLFTGALFGSLFPVNIIGTYLAYK